MISICNRILSNLPACIALLAMPVWADIPSGNQDCLWGLQETTSSSDFSLVEAGVVRHEPTGLEWRRCAEGMSWSESGCSGTASKMNWQDALQHAGTEAGWRLPSIRELRSIAERCSVDPAINTQVFPDTPSAGFWSATPNALSSTSAWSVGFYYGNDTGGASNKNDSLSVRLVRGGQ